MCAGLNAVMSMTASSDINRLHYDNESVGQWIRGWQRRELVLGLSRDFDELSSNTKFWELIDRVVFNEFGFLDLPEQVSVQAQGQ